MTKNIIFAITIYIILEVMEITAPKEYTLFKTLKPCHVMILRQPFMVTERYTAGKNKGKVKSRRPAQYNENYDSIFIEDQKKFDENPKPTHIYIKRGKLLVDNDDIQLLQAMEAHPDLQLTKDGPGLFRKVNVEQDEIFEIQAYEMLDNANSIIMQAKDSDLRTLAADLIGVHVIKERDAMLKKKLRALVSQKDEPSQELASAKMREKVVAFNEETDKNERILAIVGLTNNIISISSGNKIVWSDDQSDLIYTGSQKKDVVREFATWLQTDERGREVYASLASKLEDILDE